MATERHWRKRRCPLVPIPRALFALSHEIRLHFKVGQLHGQRRRVYFLEARTRCESNVLAKIAIEPRWFDRFHKDLRILFESVAWLCTQIVQTIQSRLWNVWLQIRRTFELCQDVRFENHKRNYRKHSHSNDTVVEITCLVIDLEKINFIWKWSACLISYIRLFTAQFISSTYVQMKTSKHQSTIVRASKDASFLVLPVNLRNDTDRFLFRTTGSQYRA